MLRRDEAQRVAHERVKDLVRVAQGVSGDLNPEQMDVAEGAPPEPTTQGKIEALGRAYEAALDGLNMLMEAEDTPKVEMTMAAQPY